MERKRGFTLIELMVVIAVVAILATLALPDMTAQFTAKQIRESLKKVERYKSSIQTIHEMRVALGAKEDELFPINNKEIDSAPTLNLSMPEPDKIIGNYIDQVTLKNGVLTLRFSKNAHGKLQGKKLSLLPTYVKNNYAQDLDWICGYKSAPTGKNIAGINETTIDKKLLPIECR